MTKSDQLRELARLRQVCVPEGYNGIAEYHDGVYECDHVSPYSKTAGNVDADIMLVLQDWSSDEFLRKPIDREVVKYGHDPGLPTNKNLKSLLKRHFNVSLSETYGTNLFPFIKPGNISTKIPSKLLVQAAKDFAIPQIEIVRPRVVVCLGLVVYNSVRRAFGMRPKPNLVSAIDTPFVLDSTNVWAQSHPGGLGRAGRNRGGKDRVTTDWAAMAEAVSGNDQDVTQ